MKLWEAEDTGFALGQLAGFIFFYFVFHPKMRTVARRPGGNRIFQA